MEHWRIICLRISRSVRDIHPHMHSIILCIALPLSFDFKRFQVSFSSICRIEVKGYGLNYKVRNQNIFAVTLALVL